MPLDALARAEQQQASRLERVVPVQQQLPAFVLAQEAQDVAAADDIHHRHRRRGHQQLFVEKAEALKLGRHLRAMRKRLQEVALERGRDLLDEAGGEHAGARELQRAGIDLAAVDGELHRTLERGKLVVQAQRQRVDLLAFAAFDHPELRRAALGDGGGEAQAQHRRRVAVEKEIAVARQQRACEAARLDRVFGN